MAKVLVIEDDSSLSRGIEYGLAADRHTVSTAKTMTEAFEKLEKGTFDLITLDINLPDGDGFEICKRLKQQQDIPVVFLTARDLIQDQENGFNLGADDYITKPFNMGIFRKRIQAVLRRYKGQVSQDVYDDGYLKINFDSAQCILSGKVLDITPTEYRLLQLFVSNQVQVLTRQTIMERIWDIEENFIDEHALTVNINRLRKKLEQDGQKYIKTVYGMGYMWIGGKQDEI